METNTELQTPVRQPDETDESFAERWEAYKSEFHRRYSGKPEYTKFRTVGGVVTTERVTQSQLEAEKAEQAQQAKEQAEKDMQLFKAGQELKAKQERERLEREKQQALKEQVKTLQAEQQADILKRLSDCEKRIAQLESRKKGFFKKG